MRNKQPAENLTSPAPSVTRHDSSIILGSPTSSSSLFTMTSASLNDEIPDHWLPEVEQCIEDKQLTDSARNEMVRSLVNVLFSRFSKPTRSKCEDLTRKLILKYPFVKDDLGNGYVSVGCDCYVKASLYNL